jgi:hypothetical protein
MTSASYYQAILPVIDVQKQIKPAEIVPISPSNITYYTIPAVGTSSGQQANSNIVFNIIPPVSDAVMSRMIRIRLQFQVNVTGAQQSNVLPGGVTPDVFNSPYCGFASFPINSIFSTLTLQINNASTTIRPSQVIKDLLRYDNSEKLIYGTMSQSPCKMDPSMDYAQTTNFIQSPFGCFADDMLSRNAYDIVYVSNPTVPAGQQVNGTLTASFIEPLIISPLCYTEEWFYYPGFGGINQATINITVDNSTLQRIFRQARNDLVTWGNVSVSIIGTPELIVGFYSLPPSIKIPPILNYKYCSIVNYTSQPVSIGQPGSSFQIQSQAIQLQSIPRAVVLSVTKSIKTYQDSDAYFPFGSVQAGGSVNNQNVISITFNNEVGILSTASVHDLYLLARKNGLEMSFSQFSGRSMNFYNLFSVLSAQQPAGPSTYYLNTVGNNGPSLLFNGSGGPLMLLFGVDIPISSNNYVGENGYYTFQITVNCLNNLYPGTTAVGNNVVQFNPASANPQAQLNLIFIFDGWMRINNGNVTFDIGLPGGLDTKQYPVLDGYPPIEQLMRGGGLGGSLFGSIGNLLRGIPIVGPLLGNLFPSDEPPIQQQPVQQTAPQVEYVEEEPQPAPKSKRSTKKGGAAIWTRYLS